LQRLGRHPGRQRIERRDGARLQQEEPIFGPRPFDVLRLAGVQLPLDALAQVSQLKTRRVR
jgi:hypothetical protein